MSFLFNEKSLCINLYLCSPGRGLKCADDSKPTCSDGSEPVKDGDKSTPPCPDGERPSTCTDGSTPTRSQGNGRGRGGCARADRVCCDGSALSTTDRPRCGDGDRTVCDAAADC